MSRTKAAKASRRQAERAPPSPPLALPARRLGTVGRADLLLALQHGDADWFELPTLVCVPGADKPGFQRREVLPQQPPPGQQLPLTAATPAATPTAKALPLKMPRAWVVTERTQSDPDESSALDPVADSSVPAPPPRATPEQARQALIQQQSQAQARQWQRLKGPLRSALHALQGRGAKNPIDWQRLTHRMARHEDLLPLPRRHLQRWPANLVLAMDRLSSSLEPFVDDMDALATRLRRSIGARGVRVLVLSSDALATPMPWLGDPRPSSTPKPARHTKVPDRTGRASKPAAWPAWAGQALLVLSDGAASQRDTERSQRLTQWLSRCAREGARAVLVGPAAPPAVLMQAKPLHTLSWEGAHARSQRLPQEQINPLLALVALLGSVSDALLRALAGLLPTSGPEAALTWHAWNHPDMLASGRRCSLRSEAQARYEALIAAFPLETLQAAVTVAGLHRAGLSEADDHLAYLRACALAPQLREGLSGTQMTAASYVGRTLPAAIADAASPEARAHWVRLAAQVVALAHPQVRQTQAPALRRLQALAHEAALRQSQAVPLYDELGPAQPPMEEDAPSDDRQTHWALVQQGRVLWAVPESLVADDEPPVAANAPEAPVGLGSGVPLARRIGPAPAGSGALHVQAGQSRWLPLSATQATAMLELPKDDEQVSLLFGKAQVRLRPLVRPRWASSWSVGPSGATFGLMLPWQEEISFPWPTALPRSAEHQGQLPSGLYWSAGVDEYGPWVRLLFGKDALQVFRLILPGSFQMGSSPEEIDAAFTDEDDRKWAQNELPRHPVTLTQAYWMADTPCTQFLWRVLMGENPSQAPGDSAYMTRPVDSVSWDRVMAFVAEVNEALPVTCRAVLPREAEWEFATRAGTQTAYHWGEHADDGKANWGAQNNGTTPVKRYEPNAWGLYDMQGNVWEWCEGSQREYRDQPEVDPPDGAGSDSRALRGGSWDSSAGRARSAFRLRSHRGYLWISSGFRLALRSPSPAAGGAGPAERVGVVGSGADDPASGRRPAVSRAERAPREKAPSAPTPPPTPRKRKRP